MIIDFAANNNALEEDTSVKRKLVDYFEEDIVDVLGPPTKKQKLYSKPLYLPSPLAATQFQYVAVAEETTTTLQPT